ncbi:peptide-methionine (S)-S-oxide reductase MsrA [Aliikangiella coralliicola]|uniref:Peptide methionine sulfoxide reductase MsrA n=1 Tax=Aliikangiella coralliicola TaxID=2592383 RepID=A0A545UC72_9GAMM|nr:peptide-methionine (S)-S-oxide reductase MsrA [Aliikangiella coralliicola]TQV87057.1 peptide-methionine (S)-S-oxide reductase MsrA [Aliikangiella coralliicola]
MKRVTLASASIIVILFFALNPMAKQHTLANAAKPTHTIDKNMPASKHLDSIVLGAGCFWGAEKRYAAIPGVIDAVSGYADGSVTPTYREITKRRNKFNPENHAEVVKVTFNTSLVSLEKILQNYFEGHDPTQLNRQGNDVGTQYRSTILTNSDSQISTALNVLNQFQTLLSKEGYGKITTQVKPLTQFYAAETYHQDYLVKNPNGYCPDHSTGVKFNNQVKNIAKVDNSVLTKGKQIIVIEAENYCPYCEKFKENVVADYQGSIPITFRLASQLTGLKIKSPTWATPTVLFLENGQEVFGKQGYMSPEEFYKALGKFKLGQSEAYNVAFNEGTDSRFCKQYEIFKNTPDGQFVDKLSGAPLFDTRDRFNSGTGWLSFTKAVDGSVYEKPDNKYGLKRIEIRSKTSDVHLGHVFPDGPNGQPRYCINATVLDFVPRQKNAVSG